MTITVNLGSRALTPALARLVGYGSGWGDPIWGQ